MEASARKAIIRRRALAARNALTGELHANASAAIAERVLALPEVATAHTVLGYASTRSEVATDGLLSALRARGVTILLPKVTALGALAAIPFTGDASLVPGFAGIREPVGEPVPASAADVVLVPGIAFDARGGRIGYGGGFYDRLLDELTAPLVGLAFDVQVVDEVPAEPHDRGMTVVVTETRSLRP